MSSRIVTARLKWPDGGINRRKAKDIYMTVVCVYAPTAKAPPGVKAKFFEDLQDTLDKVPIQDRLVLLGDFNARVGVRKSGDNLWQGD